MTPTWPGDLGPGSTHSGAAVENDDRPAPPWTDGRVVADAMIGFPKTCSPATTAAQAREMLRNDHVHALLVLEGRRLLAVVERVDLVAAPDDVPARLLGTLAGRTVGPLDPLDGAMDMLQATSRRRLAVVDEAGLLLGLLCLKRSRRGFCSDEGVRSRAEERARPAVAPDSARERPPAAP